MPKDSTSGLLNPDDYTWFSQQKRRINDTYALGLPQNQWMRRVQRNQFARQKANLVDKFTEMREALPGTFAGRGLLNSGLYRKGIADLASDRLRAMGQMRGGFEDQMFGMDLARRQMESVRTNALKDIREQEAARRATIAAALRKARA